MHGPLVHSCTGPKRRGTVMLPAPAVHVQARCCSNQIVLCRLLQYNPCKRLTAREALQHPYFKQPPLPTNACYPSGYKPRYSSKATREQQKKKPVAAAGNAAVAAGKPGAAAKPAGTAKPGAASKPTGGASGSARHHVAARNTGGSAQQGKARATSGANAVNRVEKKGAHVKKKTGKSDK